MFTKPSFDFGNLLTLFCVLFAIGIASVLGGCTTAKPTPTTSTRYVVERDSRTKHAEPYPSRVR